ncbi:unnamed protein product [Citrullus colocynthis]|uniref:Uncharacterized protein n=1 Tax=Citrullus colocynthis TaxID=252529 RepID=A0ABP0Z9G9_9ROSI
MLIVVELSSTKGLSVSGKLKITNLDTRVSFLIDEIDLFHGDLCISSPKNYPMDFYANQSWTKNSSRWDFSLDPKVVVALKDLAKKSVIGEQLLGGLLDDLDALELGLDGFIFCYGGLQGPPQLGPQPDSNSSGSIIDDYMGIEISSSIFVSTTTDTAASVSIISTSSSSFEKSSSESLISISCISKTKKSISSRKE